MPNQCPECERTLPTKEVAQEVMKNTGKDHIVCPCGESIYPEQL